MRLFIAIDLPTDIRHALTDLQFPSRSIRWNRSEQIHLTLSFLGDQPDHQLEPLCEALSEIELTPFTLHTKEIGCFRQGALWLGLETSEPLSQLQARINRRVQQCGIALESRRFHPHLTLGRCRKNPAPAVEILQSRLEYRKYSFEVDRFLLKSSVLRQDGAVHQTEAEFIAT